MKAISCKYGYGVENSDKPGTANSVGDGTKDFKSVHEVNTADGKVKN